MSKIIKYMVIVALIGYFITLFAQPPGGGEDGWRECFCNFTVTDPNGDPVGGVQVEFIAEVFGSEGDGLHAVNGTTNSEGWVNLSSVVYY